MEELNKLKLEIQEVTNRQIRLETIIEQAKQQCKEIEQKYNIKNEEELKTLLDKAEDEYNMSIADACNYLTEAKLALAPYEGMV